MTRTIVFTAFIVMMITTPAGAEVVQPIEPDCTAISGDTFWCYGERWRLWGVNAPELGEPCFNESTAALQEMISTGNMVCAGPPSRQVTDRFGRLVSRCFLFDGDVAVDVAAALVSAGLAVDVPRYSRAEYADEQASATPCR